MFCQVLFLLSLLSGEMIRSAFTIALSNNAISIYTRFLVLGRIIIIKLNARGDSLRISVVLFEAVN